MKTIASSLLSGAERDGVIEMPRSMRRRPPGRLSPAEFLTALPMFVPCPKYGALKPITVGTLLKRLAARVPFTNHRVAAGSMRLATQKVGAPSR